MRHPHSSWTSPGAVTPLLHKVLIQIIPPLCYSFQTTEQISVCSRSGSSLIESRYLHQSSSSRISLQSACKKYALDSKVRLLNHSLKCLFQCAPTEADQSDEHRWEVAQCEPHVRMPSCTVQCMVCSWAPLTSQRRGHSWTQTQEGCCYNNSTDHLLKHGKHYFIFSINYWPEAHVSHTR